MVKYGELDRALTVYICSSVRDAIPVEYYRRVLKTTFEMNNNGKSLDMQQAAAILLYFAFNDGHLHPSQLTVSGLQALDYAEKLLQETGPAASQADETSDHSIKLAANSKALK